MNGRLASAAAMFVVVFWCSAVPGGEVALNGHRFTLPDGFEIELVAGPPLVDRPITADFDEQGRLYVADSSGSNDPVQKQLEERPHQILRLEDTDGDGRYDRRTVFADRMMFPEGTMWYDGSLYVAAPPSIWKLTDTDGDGVADERVEWFQGKTLTGCANDLHGPYLGPDGWIYWCKGAFAEQTYERPGRKPLVTKASHIFRCRPDGSGIEPVMTGGMDNPVDVVFTPGGERIFTTTFLQHPGGGRRDGLLHAVCGGVYGKVHHVIEGHPRTDPEVMPVLSHLGPAAPCGLARYESDVFGAEYQDNLFACLFNLQRVTRHVLEPDRATFRSRDEDFLVSDNKDFHPTDVLEDADGSLLVVDTGGWYKLCCPTSQLHKPDVLGGIYRIRRTDALRVEDPRGLMLDWSAAAPHELARRLDDPRPAVRWRAVQALGASGADALPELTEILSGSASPRARLHAVWTLARIDDPAARAATRTAALNDGDDAVRQAALHSVSLWRDAEAAGPLTDLLQNGSSQNQRAAAEALGRIGDASALPVLFARLEQPADRFLEHSLIYALIEIADADGMASRLSSTHPRVRRAALMALDQMEGEGLQPEPLLAALKSSDADLTEAAWWIAGRHPEWGEQLSAFLGKQMAAASQPDLPQRIAKLAASPAIQELLVERLRDPAASPQEREIALRAIAQSGLKDVPPAWTEALAHSLTNGDETLIPLAVSAARSLPIKKDAGPLADALLQVAAGEALPTETRLEALAAVPGGVGELSPAVFEFLTAQLAPDQAVTARTFAADVLAKAKLSNEQLLRVAELLRSAGPLEAGRLLEAFARSRDERVGLALVACLHESPALGSLRVETLRPLLEKYGPRMAQEAEALYAELTAGMQQQAERLDELLELVSGGDVRRGQAVFNSAKAACASCHAIGYLGGKIGPDLTRIGRIRTERDLLEAIAFPSASFVRSYEPVVIVTLDGRIHSGVTREETAGEVVLATGVNQEVRIPREDIDIVRPGTVSVMPAGLEQQLTPEELADLVAFLKACK